MPCRASGCFLSVFLLCADFPKSKLVHSALHSDLYDTISFYRNPVDIYRVTNEGLNDFSCAGRV